MDTGMWMTELTMRLIAGGAGAHVTAVVAVAAAAALRHAGLRMRSAGPRGAAAEAALLAAAAAITLTLVPGPSGTAVYASGLAAGTLSAELSSRLRKAVPQSLEAPRE